MITKHTKRKINGLIEIEIHAKSQNESGLSMWEELCTILNQIYERYEILDRLDHFEPARYIKTEMTSKKDVYSFPKISIWLRCKRHRAGHNPYKNIVIYQYGNGEYAKPFEKRYADELSKIKEGYTVKLEHENYIPPHNAGWIVDHYCHRGPEVCTYLLCRQNNS